MTAGRTPAARGRGLALAVLVAATAVFGLLLIPDAMVILLMPMAFDSGPTIVTSLLAGIVWSYPVVALIGLAGGWWLYRRRRYRAAVLVGLLPLLNVAALAILFGLAR